MTENEIRPGAPINIDLPSPEVLNSIEEEILIRPSVLESSLSTLIERYVHTITEDSTYITPETIISLDEKNPHNLIVFAGHTEKDYSKKIIYQKNPGTGLSAEWIIFSKSPDGDVIKDGRGTTLETKARRQYIRDVLDSMNSNYAREVNERADNFDIKQHLIEVISSEIAVKEAQLNSLQNQLAAAEQHSDTFDRFKVNIRSGWEREGEKPLDEEIDATTLSRALHIAAVRFKESAGRSDIQAQSFSIGVSVEGKKFSWIPNEVLLPLFRSLSSYDREAYEIQKLKKSKR